MALSDPVVTATGCCSGSPVIGTEQQSDLDALTSRVRSLEIANAALQADINSLKSQALVCIDVDFAAQAFSYTTFAGVITTG